MYLFLKCWFFLFIYEPLYSLVFFFLLPKYRFIFWSCYRSDLASFLFWLFQSVVDYYCLIYYFYYFLILNLSFYVIRVCFFSIKFGRYENGTNNVFVYDIFRIFRFFFFQLFTTMSRTTGNQHIYTITILW